jgi:hypothetical protein
VRSDELGRKKRGMDFNTSAAEFQEEKGDLSSERMF